MRRTIRKLLIANRGEIACRIIRTCREMGIATVAVYSDADQNALHVEMADEAVHVGSAPASESYLNQAKLIEAALWTGADAIHPGYGFLAENAQFAYLVRSAGLIFVGPSAESIEAMGDKRMAKVLLHEVPYVPGYIGDDQSDEALLKAADDIGMPIMVKATAGGGGKGMRLVQERAALPEALSAARREAEQAFGNPSLMLERAILQPRHIEVQVFGDQHGTVIALGERECSIQRRHQKIIEETPSTALTPELRTAICQTAVHIAQQIGYYSAGTIEFLLDTDQRFYFMEMNTRLQVEHPVTEAVFGIDLVRWQIEVACGHPLDSLTGGRTLSPQGHAIEVRVCAEDPANHFLPVIGDIIHWSPPPYVRTDAGIRSGDSISPYYDSMIAKVIAHGKNRAEAIQRLDYALAHLQLLGIKNNVHYLRRILLHDEHLEGKISTQFIAQHPELSSEVATVPVVALIGAALSREPAGKAWRNNPNRPVIQRFRFNEQVHEVALQATPQGYRAQVLNLDVPVQVIERHATGFTLVVDGHRQPVTVVQGKGDDIWTHTLTATNLIHWVSPFPAPQTQDAEAGGGLHAPMTGQVRKVMVEVGQSVEKGTLLLIMEAMKMEHRIEAPYAGIVEQVRYGVGDSVQQDEVLLSLKKSE